MVNHYKEGLGCEGSKHYVGFISKLSVTVMIIKFCFKHNVQFVFFGIIITHLKLRYRLFDILIYTVFNICVGDIKKFRVRKVIITV